MTPPDQIRVPAQLQQLQRFVGRHPKVAEAVELRRRVAAAIGAR